jgi:hypothetical protein
VCLGGKAMGCVSGKASVEGGPGRTQKLRLGDRLFERRDQCVEQFAQALCALVDKRLLERSTRSKVKEAYDDGIYRLFIAQATPTVRLFLEGSIVRERLQLVNDSGGTDGAGPQTVELVQYAQTEESLTKPVAARHGLGLYLQPIADTDSYGVWIAWHRQQPNARRRADPLALPGKLRLNEGLLNPTISIGALSIEGH